MTNDKKPRQTITLTVDNVEFTVSDRHQTAGAILTLAGLDPAGETRRSGSAVDAGK